DPPLTELPQNVAKKVTAQTDFVHRLWQGNGNVVVGKLEIPLVVDRQRVASRTILMPDDWFAARLFRGRTLTFRAHGFTSVDITPPEGAPLVYDVGTIKLEPIDKDALTSVHATAAVPEGYDCKRMRVQLLIEQPPQIFADDGYEGGPMQPVARQKSVRPSEA